MAHTSRDAPARRFCALSGVQDAGCHSPASFVDKKFVMNRSPSRRAFATGALVLSAAGAAGAQTGPQTGPQTGAADAMSIGSITAPLHLVEYASASCSHCAHFHNANWATLKTNYIDAGHLRLTLQEMLTAPPALAFAMFQLSRCGNADAPEYFRRLGILFERQQAIFASGTVGGAVTSLVAAGAEWGLGEAQVMANFNDEAGGARIGRLSAAANAAGVTSTPTFFLNGQRLGNDFQTQDVMTRTLDAALNRHG